MIYDTDIQLHLAKKYVCLHLYILLSINMTAEGWSCCDRDVKPWQGETKRIEVKGIIYTKGDRAEGVK